MSRPKAYERNSVVLAARDLFWERGYEATSISDLEQRTGLNRSSLYQEFGSKHELLAAALTCYADQVVDPLLADLSAPGADLDTIDALFTRLADLFSSGARPATSGCLLVNSIAELASREDRVRSARRRLPRPTPRQFRHDPRERVTAKAGGPRIRPTASRPPGCDPDGRLAHRPHRSRRRKPAL